MIYTILRLLVLLLLFSYSIGLFWWLYVSFIEQIYLEHVHDMKHEEIVSFISENDMKEEHASHINIVVIYFALTTLTSVGFGDYHPKNTFERAGCIFIFLLVLFVWPLLVSKLLNSFALLQNTFSDNTPTTELAQFFGILEHFNNNNLLNKELQTQFEEYFNKYWEDDKLELVLGNKYSSYFQSLPYNEQVVLIRDILFYKYF